MSGSNRRGAKCGRKMSQSCPICSYFDCDVLDFDDEVDDELSLDDRTATSSA